MYTPLSVHTHYSLLRAFARPSELVKECAKLDISSLAITDYGLSGSVDFFSEAEKKNIKPIIGLKVKVDGYYLTLVSKNLNGWYELIKISNKANFSETESVTFDELSELKNVVVILNSVDGICDGLVNNQGIWFNQNPEKYLSYFLVDSYESKLKSEIEKYSRVFRDNLFVGINRLNEIISPIDKIFNDALVRYANLFNIEICALSNVHYIKQEQQKYQTLLLASNAKLTIDSLKSKLESDAYAKLNRFFNKEMLVNGHVMTEDDMKVFYSERELANTRLISDMCEKYSILDRPSLPKFDCPDGLPEGEYLLKLCRDGWLRLKDKLETNLRDKYGQRVKDELEILQGANLEGYFLIVQDYCNWVKSQGVLVGCGRGSAGGSLISYLLGITDVDSIKYDLLFSRFYNEGRNSPGKVSLPDIDCDFPVYFRENVIDYIRNKYTKEKVSQVATFSRMQGRMAFREVLRSMSSCPMDIINAISKKLPQEAAIADKLEEEKETSIIRWTLKNEPELVSDYCKLVNGELVGEFATYFSDAIEIEGCFKSYGKHASALLISDKIIADNCPILHDKSTNAPLAGIPYEDLESMGFVKMDILGLQGLDRETAIQDLLKFGKIKFNISNNKEEIEDE